MTQIFWWSELELNQPLGFFRPALILLSYPTEEGTLCFVLCTLISTRTVGSRIEAQSTKFKAHLEAPLSFAMHLVHDFTIIVHVHEQVLAPFGSRLGIVTKHDAFELNAQGSL